MKPGTLLPYLKAVIAFVVPGASLLYMATFDDSLGHEAITSTELIRAGLVCILTSGGVAVAKNADKPTAQGRHERGALQVGVSGALAFLALVALCLVILRLLGADTRIFA